ncbi:MAG: type II toxin-antitoxin system VapC family toxin [Xanthomonadales bacterium]|nr:type II toxin-antitoxin system VapC family toxin [Xanthomonadales bacterium]
MPVVDTNVLAYAVFGQAEVSDAALGLLKRKGEITVPDLLFAELANVAWQQVRHSRFDPGAAQAALLDAHALVDVSLPTADLMTRALELAIAADHSAYDAVFVAAAEAQNTHLLTFDRRLVDRFSPVARLAGPH